MANEYGRTFCATTELLLDWDMRQQKKKPKEELNYVGNLLISNLFDIQVGLNYAHLSTNY